MPAEAGDPAGAPVILTPAQRARKFGFHCASEFEWKGWEPGGEYVKTIIVKNVGKKMQRIKFKLPSTKFFSMPFPEWIKLGPGMHHSIPVLFRPIVAEEYHDFVEFLTDQGSFFVSVKATLPGRVVVLPDAVEFGYCAVNEVAEQTFLFRNPGELASTFSFATTPPFTVIPSRGLLQPGETRSIVIKFSPKEASNSVASIVCHVAEEESRRIQVTGIGKYPFLTCREATLDFGEVHTGESVERELVFRNQSIVGASWAVARVEGGGAHDEDFAFTPTRGVVGPEGSVALRVRYSPPSTGTFSAEHYDISTPGGNTIRVTCRGTAIGPSVSLSAPSLNFGDVQAGSSQSRAVTIYNNSDVAAAFHFQAERNGVFRFSRTSGTINPQSSVSFMVKFAPPEPCNYLRRVYCLVHHQRPLYIDLFGTCFDETRRPAPFDERHVKRHRSRRLPLPLPEGEAPREEAPLDTWSELFVEDTDARLEVALEEAELDFGPGSKYRANEPRTIHVTNRGAAKITCMWAPPEGAEAPFAVIPSSADVKPSSTMAFRAVFQPRKEMQTFCGQVECYAYVKTMRNFRLVTDDAFVPPWCLAPVFAGHTFPPELEQFPPDCAFGQRVLRFPPVHVGDRAHETLAIYNRADTPARFQLQHDPSGVFECLPRTGLVPAGELVLIAVRFTPAKAKNYERVLRCVFNGNASSAQEVSLSGQGHVARIRVDGDGQLVFKPTCVGGASTRPLTIANPSRIPVQFHWEIPHRLAGVLSVEPRSGTLLGNEAQAVQWTFAPSAAKLYEAKLQCLATPVGAPAGAPTASGTGTTAALSLRSTLSSASGRSSERVAVSLVAEGTTGWLEFDPQELDLGGVLVGSKRLHTFAVVNRGQCAMYFRLEFERRAEGDDDAAPSGENGRVSSTWLSVRTGPSAFDENAPSAPKGVVEFSPAQGVIAAGTRQDVILAFRPRKRGRYAFALRVVYSASAAALEAALGPGQGPDAAVFSAESLLRATASYPTAQIADVRGEGYSLAQVWRMLAVDAINAALTGDLTHDEVRLNTSGGNSKGREEALGGLASAVFDFGSGQLEGPPTRVHVLLRNTGVIPVSWALRFPAETEADVERWVDLAERTAEEKQLAFVMEHDLFDARPRQGVLAPGETARVSLTHHRKFPGTHTCPVHLQLLDGKSALLQLTGRTLGPEERVLDMFPEVVELAPVAIGEQTPVLQSVELLSGSAAPLEYEIDTAAVERLREESYGFEVLRCENPRGTLPPRGRAFLRWLFRPLEAKTYEVPVPVRIAGGDVYVTRLVARGYHPKQQQQEAAPAEEAAGAGAPGAVAGPPERQLLRVPTQALYLSHERVSFGEVPPLSVHRRLLLLHNASAHAVRFAWRRDHPLFQQGLRVEPAEGELEAGARLNALLVLTATPGPCAHVADLFCDVSPAKTPHHAMSMATTATATHRSAAAPLAAPPEEELMESGGLANGTMRSGAGSMGASGLRSTAARGPARHVTVVTSASRFSASLAARSAGGPGPAATQASLGRTAGSARSGAASPDPATPAAAAGFHAVSVRVELRVLSREACAARDFDTSPVFVPKLRPAAPRPPPPPPSPASPPRCGREPGRPRRLGLERRQPARAPSVAALASSASARSVGGPAPGPAERSQDEVAVAQGVLLGLFQELLREPIVGTALRSLDEEPIPFFLQLASAPPSRPETPRTPSRASLRPQAPPSLVISSAPSPAPTAPSPPLVAAPALNIADGGAAHARLPALEEAGAATALIEAAAAAAEAERQETLIRAMPEFEGLAEGVLERVLFGLLGDALDGTFDMFRDPRQVVTQRIAPVA
eukprot:tig00021348_g20600.t1